MKNTELVSLGKNEGGLMSQYSATNKNKHPKVYFEQYLYNSREPLDNFSSDTPPELEAEQLENSFTMRRRFRHIAQRIRNRYL